MAKNQEGLKNFPYMISDEGVQKFITEAVHSLFIQPYDWMTWKIENKLIQSSHVRRVNDENWAVVMRKPSQSIPHQ